MGSSCLADAHHCGHSVETSSLVYGTNESICEKRIQYDKPQIPLDPSKHPVQQPQKYQPHEQKKQVPIPVQKNQPANNHCPPRDPGIPLRNYGGQVQSAARNQKPLIKGRSESNQGRYRTPSKQK